MARLLMILLLLSATLTITVYSAASSGGPLPPCEEVYLGLRPCLSYLKSNSEKKPDEVCCKGVKAVSSLCHKGKKGETTLCICMKLGILPWRGENPDTSRIEELADLCGAKAFPKIEPMPEL